MNIYIHFKEFIRTNVLTSPLVTLDPLLTKGAISKVVFFCVLICTGIPLAATPQGGDSVDLIIFSYNRPMQLYALLESIEQRMDGVASSWVIGRAANAEYEQAYKIVEKRFPHTFFLWQPTDGGKFQELVLQAFNLSPSKYMAFAVDDMIVTEPINLQECTALLEQHQAHSFHLRLGKDFTYCYNARKNTAVPSLTKVTPEVYSWQFPKQALQQVNDWSNPYTVDMAIYHKADITHNLHAMSYPNPNMLEYLWSKNSPAGLYGLCHAQSHIVNIPLNIVQTPFKLRNMNLHSPQELLSFFMSGKKIDIKPFRNLKRHAAHEEIAPTFIARTGES